MHSARASDDNKPDATSPPNPPKTAITTMSPTPTKTPKLNEPMRTPSGDWRNKGTAMDAKRGRIECNATRMHRHRKFWIFKTHHPHPIYGTLSAYSGPIRRLGKPPKSRGISGHADLRLKGESKG
jgi:hypothetical protein